MSQSRFCFSDFQFAYYDYFLLTSMTTSFTALVENVITCPVCLRHFDEPRMLPCKHTFCFECIQQMTSKNNGLLECPKKDGTKVQGNNINALPPNQTVRDLIQLFSKTFNNFHSHHCLVTLFPSRSSRASFSSVPWMCDQ